MQCQLPSTFIDKESIQPSLERSRFLRGNGHVAWNRCPMMSHGVKRALYRKGCRVGDFGCRLGYCRVGSVGRESFYHVSQMSPYWRLSARMATKLATDISFGE